MNNREKIARRLEKAIEYVRQNPNPDSINQIVNTAVNAVAALATPTDDSEPVAWRYERKGKGDSNAWFGPYLQQDIEPAGGNVRNVEPLYLHPSPSISQGELAPISDEAVERALRAYSSERSKQRDENQGFVFESGKEAAMIAALQAASLPAVGRGPVERPTQEDGDTALDAFNDVYEAEYFVTGATDNKEVAIKVALEAVFRGKP